MTQLPNDSTNPYRAPAADPGLSESVFPPTINRGLVKNFRDQIVALGAFWIIISAIAGLAAFFVRGADVVIFSVVVVASLLWFVIGVCTCLKQIWAVYVGLVLSYLSVLGNIASRNVCAIVLLIFAIIQAHRVIKWANQMRAAGLPLNTKP